VGSRKHKYDCGICNPCKCPAATGLRAASCLACRQRTALAAAGASGFMPLEVGDELLVLVDPFACLAAEAGRGGGSGKGSGGMEPQGRVEKRRQTDQHTPKPKRPRPKPKVPPPPLPALPAPPAPLPSAPAALSLSPLSH
jgi:hypothetical protein